MDYPQDDVQLVFIELPKFTKPLEKLTTQAERWLYFMRHAHDLTAVPDEFADHTPLNQAFQFANAAQLTAEEIEDLEKREIFIHDQRNALLKASKQGMREGFQKGLEQGMEKGMEQGLEQALTRLVASGFAEAEARQLLGL